MMCVGFRVLSRKNTDGILNVGTSALAPCCLEVVRPAVHGETAAFVCVNIDKTNKYQVGVYSWFPVFQLLPRLGQTMRGWMSKRKTSHIQ